MRVLIACEFSGIVRDAFTALGHDAWSCDLLPSERPGQHIEGSVLDYLEDDWDLMIAHPPCTYLTNAGARWLYKGGKGTEKDPVRWEEMLKGAEFFKLLLNCGIPRIAVENPIMHSYARDLVKQNKSQTIQPWQFGHAETKATCLWLKGLPALVPTDVIAPDYMKYPRRVQIRKATGEVAQSRGSGYATRIIGGSGGYDPRVHHASPGPDRWKERSRTMPGIAAAMAQQWGSL